MKLTLELSYKLSFSKNLKLYISLFLEYLYNCNICGLNGELELLCYAKIAVSTANLISSFSAIRN